MGVVEFDSRVRNQFSIRYFLRTMGGTLEENSIEREIGRPLVANPKLRWICIVYIYIPDSIVLAARRIANIARYSRRPFQFVS